MTSRKLPKVIQSSKVGYTSADLLMSVLGKFSNIYPIPTERDLGIDMRGEMLDQDIPNGLHFNVQCKGTEEVEESVEFISIPIKVTTINYWLQQKQPTFLVVVDRENQIFYWTYPFQQVSEKIDEIQVQEKVSIRVPINSCFDSKTKLIPQKMVEIMENYESNNLENYAQTLRTLPTVIGSLNMNDPLISRISGMHENMSKILDTAKIIEQTYNTLHLSLETSINQEIDKYRDVIIWLDHEPKVRNYITSDCVYDEPFGNGLTPQQTIDRVRDSLNRFSNDKSRNNLDELLESIFGLAELNRHLLFFLREILYENNPDGDYDFLIKEYKM
jgi:predicted house-cleaning noncanonical NTP pyrophosphatase (MazG superfamily)